MKSFFGARSLFYILIFAILILSVFQVRAQITIPNPLEGTAGNFPDLITLIATVIFNVSLWIAPLMIIIAGYYWTTAGGNPNQINTAKQILMWTLIGLAISFSALGIIELFESIF